MITRLYIAILTMITFIATYVFPTIAYSSDYREVDHRSDMNTINFDWRFDLGGCYGSEIATDSRYIYFGTQSGELHKLDLDGSIVWKFKIFDGGELSSTPILCKDGSVVCSSIRNGGISKVSRDGNLEWIFEGPSVNKTQIAKLNDHVIYYDYLNNQLGCLSSVGDLVWEIQPTHGISSNLTTNEDLGLCYFMFDGYLYSVDIQGNKNKITYISKDSRAYIAVDSNEVLLIRLESNLWIVRSGRLSRVVHLGGNITAPLVRCDTNSWLTVVKYHVSHSSISEKVESEYSLVEVSVSGATKILLSTNDPAIVSPISDNGLLLLFGWYLSTMPTIYISNDHFKKTNGLYLSTTVIGLARLIRDRIIFRTEDGYLNCINLSTLNF